MNFISRDFGRLRSIVVSLLFSAVVAAGCGDDHEGAHNHAIDAVDNRRSWIEEREFARNPELRAAPEQIVLLRLDSEPRGNSPKTHLLPYRIEESAPYTLCIPADEPLVLSVELLPEGAGIASKVTRGECETVMVEAGNMANRADAALQTSAAGRQRVASALASGILAFLAIR